MTEDRQAYYQELRHESAAERRYSTALALHPRCDDPEHPGCANCQDEEDENV